MTQYLITSGGDTQWHRVGSKTLLGAKQMASRTYARAIGGSISVGQGVYHPSGEAENIVVATKSGYENWINL